MSCGSGTRCGREVVGCFRRESDGDCVSVSDCGIGGISVGIGTAPIGQGGGGDPLNWDLRPNSFPKQQ